MSNFFISGMPRSRSGWFANYLTFGSSICYHDPFAQTIAPEVIAKLKDEDWAYSQTGISDSGLVLWWEQFRDAFPNSPWVVIERPMAEVEASCQRIVSVNTARILSMRRKLDELIAELEPMRVAFDEITPQVAMSIADYCGVDAGNMDRAEMLCEFNVQIHPPLLKSKIDKLLTLNETVLA